MTAAQADMPGCPSVAGAHCSLDALELAVGLARSGTASGVVTGPVSKQQLYAHRLRPPRPDRIRRRALRRVARQCRDDARRADACAPSRSRPICRSPRSPRVLTAALIEARGRAALRGLQRSFGIAEPRLAVAGLNPACRRRRRARARGDRPHHPRDRGAARPKAGTSPAPTPPTPCSTPRRARATTPPCACITTRR